MTFQIIEELSDRPEQALQDEQEPCLLEEQPEIDHFNNPRIKTTKCIHFG